jgi:hypothetical protein
VIELHGHEGPIVLAPSYRTHIGVALLACGTVGFELFLTRLLSVRFVYHFAFAVISLAMFGLTAGAVLIHLSRRFLDRDAERLRRVLVGACFLYAVTLVAASIWLFEADIRFGASMWEAGSIRLYLVTSVPFTCAGVAFCIVLTRFQSVSRLYAADLVGAGCGGVALIALLSFVDPRAALFLLAAAILLAGTFLADDLDARNIRLGLGLAASALLMGACQASGFVVFAPPLADDGERPAIFERWNAFSRVTVHPLGHRAFGWGWSSTCPREVEPDQLFLYIDRKAGTVMTQFDGDLRRIEYLRCDVTNAAHEIRSNGDVLVIGLGGGRDVLSALLAGQRSVTAVEVNDIIVDLARDKFAGFTGHLADDPRVRIVADEARSYVAGHDRRYDVIQASLIDTFAASSAGAFALTENGLYTVEAWVTFLEHLTDQGLLAMSRWHYYEDPPFETLRLAALARAALAKLGVSHFADKVVLVSGGRWWHAGSRGTGTLLVKRTPFSREEIERLREWAGRMHFTIVYAPGLPSDSRFTTLLTASDPGWIYERSALDISPPTDDRPFYFLMKPQDAAAARYESEIVYTSALTVLRSLLLAASAMAVLALVLPVLATASLRIVAEPVHLAGALFFVAIGIGYLTIEIAQMQRLTTFLGHPNYAFSVVLSALLVSSGLGSLWSEGGLIESRRPERRALGLGAGLLAILVLWASFAGPLLQAAESRALSVRVAVSIAAVAPAGFLMGTFFPTGMRVALTVPDSPTAWFWAVNGAASVVASVLATMLAVERGIRFSLFVGAAAYALAVAALQLYVRLARRAVEP